MPTSVTWKGAVDGNVSVKYDNNFNVTSQTINGVDTVKFSYDNDGLLASLEASRSGLTNAGNMALNYNAQNGLLTGTTLGNVTTSQGYSNYGELSSYTANYSSSPIFQTSYSRDSLGRITTLNETELGAAKTLNYSYDAVGRLQNVWRNDTLVSTYSYDANGNRIAHWTPTEIDSGTYDAQDRMLSYAGAQYIYGLSGDLQTKIAGTDTTKYTYDALGNLTQVVMPNGDVIQYVIDGQNRRIAKKLNGKIVERWIYSRQLSPVAEVDSLGNVVAQFVGSYMFQGGATYQLVTDHLGSVRLVVNISTGTVAERMDYDEFGNVTYDSNPGFQPFGFAGGLYDPEMKLVRFGARDYDAETGRWTSPDPLRFGGRLANLFSYASANPVNLVDPSGLKTCVGRARVLKTGHPGLINNPDKPGSFHISGGIPPNSAAVAEQQWGGWNLLSTYRTNVSAWYSGGQLFSGVSDIIGGPMHGKLTTREWLMQQNPGEVIIELYSAPNDLGHVFVVINMPDDAPCPQNTVEMPRLTTPCSTAAADALAVH